MSSLEIDHIIYDIRKKLGWIDFFVYLRMNGIALDNVLDISLFAKAVTFPGNYPLFTCECGWITCSGFCVDVECEDHYWIMKNRYKPGKEITLGNVIVGYEKGELIEEVTYQFPWAQVREVAFQIDEALNNAISEAPPHVHKPQSVLIGLETAIDNLNRRLQSR